MSNFTKEVMLIFSKSKTNLEYNLSINNINGILQAFSINLVVPFAGLYAKRLNANDTHIALLNSYPAVFCILAVFLGTGLFTKYKQKQKITSISFILARSFFLIFILIPFFPSWIQPGLFVLMYGAMNFPNSLATMGWQSFLGDLFSDTWRGRAFSKRSSLSTISALIVTFITGNLLFYIPKNNTQRIHLYQIFFAIAFILSLFEVFSFTKHRLDKNCRQIETVTSNLEENKFDTFKKTVSMIKGNKNFLYFCICVVFFHFSWQMGWPLFFSYEVDILHSNESWTSITNTVSFIAQAIAYVLWQKFSEKKGNNLAIFYATLFMACCPFFYIISKSMFQVAVFTVVTGSATAGTLLLLSNNLYETAPDENRTIYIAAYTVLTNITLIFAPIIGMKIKNITNIYNALLIVGILRILSSFTFYFRHKYLKNKELV